MAAFIRLIGDSATANMEMDKEREFLKRTRSARLCCARRRNEGKRRREVQWGSEGKNAVLFHCKQFDRYVDVPQDMVRSYNRCHLTTGMAPSEVNTTNQEEV